MNSEFKIEKFFNVAHLIEDLKPVEKAALINFAVNFIAVGQTEQVTRGIIKEFVGHQPEMEFAPDHPELPTPGTLWL